MDVQGTPINETGSDTNWIVLLCRSRACSYDAGDHCGKFGHPSCEQKVVVFNAVFRRDSISFSQNVDAIADAKCLAAPLNFK